jgi:hypothetical protein
MPSVGRLDHRDLDDWRRASLPGVLDAALGSTRSPRETPGMAGAVRPRCGALAIIGIALFGCGARATEAPPSCLTVHPCGGDLIGTWRFLGACTADAATFTALAGARCAGSAVSRYDVGVSGQITFNADLTYGAQAWNTSFDESSTLPESCGNGTSCAEQSLSVTSSDGSFSNRTCSGGGVCACSASGLSAVTETGTYTTTGIEFRLVGPTTSRTRSYCVEGTFLHIIEAGPPSGDQTTPTVVFTDSVATRL